MKKALLVLALVCVVTGFLPQIASAQTFTCTITKCGPASGNEYIALTDAGGTFTSRWFIATDAQEKEMLAVALFAMANNKQVQVTLSGTAQYSTITKMYVIN